MLNCDYIDNVSSISNGNLVGNGGLLQWVRGSWVQLDWNYLCQEKLGETRILFGFELQRQGQPVTPPPLHERVTVSTLRDGWLWRPDTGASFHPHQLHSTKSHPRQLLHVPAYRDAGGAPWPCQYEPVHGIFKNIFTYLFYNSTNFRTSSNSQNKGFFQCLPRYSYFLYLNKVTYTLPLVFLLRFGSGWEPVSDE